MKISLQKTPAAEVVAQALVSFVFEPLKEPGKTGEAALPEFDPALAGPLAKFASSGCIARSSTEWPCTLVT